MIIAQIVGKPFHIPVDEWDTEKYPIEEKDRIFKNIKGEIILPISELFCPDGQKRQQLNCFAMNSKRSYNSDETRMHICKYLNYFEKYYDFDKELLLILYKMKMNIDYERLYNIQNFMSDVNRYIIRNPNLGDKIRRFVDDNYMMKLSSNNNRTPNLQFNNEHAKVLYEISLMMNMYIPLATHYMYIHFIKQPGEIQNFMLSLFDMCMVKYEEERGIYIYDKIYETAASVVNKSKSADKPLWQKNQIRGINTTTHTKDSVCDIILQIMPKYSYSSNIINFNYYSNRKHLQYKITDIAYEYPFVKLSSTDRDEDQNSAYDRYESRLNHKDEALALQNKVAAEQTVEKIEALYGPFTKDEIDFYRRRLTKDKSPVIQSFQKQLIGYLYYKEFGDPITYGAIHSQIDYIKLMIASKRMLLRAGLTILPYVISSRVVRMANRKLVAKKETIRIESSELYAKIKEKYNNDRITQHIIEMVGTVISSSFEIIDYDNEHKCAGQYDGVQLPIINDIIDEEFLYFTTII